VVSMFFTKDIVIIILNKYIDINKYFNLALTGKKGAIVSFIGTVKKRNLNKNVLKIKYVVFKSLAYSMLKKQCIYFVSKYNCQIYIYQYDGVLYIDDVNILIIVNSNSRFVSFSICSSLLEFIKNNVPIWKKEFYIDNTYKWINS